MSLSKSETTETYQGPGNSANIGGVVGPDGQMDSTTTGSTGKSKYNKSTVVSDNAVTTEHEVRQAAPGGVESLHVGVVLDSSSLKGVDPSAVQSLLASAVGIDTSRGDTLEVTQLPFDRSTEKAAAAEIKASQEAASKEQMFSYAKTGGLAGLVALMVLLAWLQSRRNTKKREQATSYMVEQLRKEAADRQAAQSAIEAHQAAMAAIEAGDSQQTNEIRDEISALVERQPEDVASLLRGWLVERGS